MPMASMIPEAAANGTPKVTASKGDSSVNGNPVNSQCAAVLANISAAKG